MRETCVCVVFLRVVCVRVFVRLCACKYIYVCARPSVRVACAVRVVCFGKGEGLLVEQGNSF